MSGKGKISAVILLVIICAFGFGLYNLFILRFEKGDIYPPYSSLRSDPLGSKAFFASLGDLNGMATRRNFLELSRLRKESPVTIFYLGADADRIDISPKKQIDAMESLAAAGNRLVIAFAPAHGGPARPRAGEAAAREDKGRKDEKPCECFFSKWGISPGRFTRSPDNDKVLSKALLVKDGANLPEAVSWHSDLFFEIEDGTWHPVYSVDGKAVVIERAVGRGSVVMLSDSYLASNEAMRNERRPELLAWLQGPDREAVFDENHLGVGDAPGIMSLVNKYRLAPFIACLIMVAVLYLWKSSVAFVPRAVAARPEDGGHMGKDNFGGLLSLLRRAVAPGDILDICFREWSKSFSRRRRIPPSTLEQVKAVLDRERSAKRKERNPVQGYEEISEILTERKFR